MCSVHFFGSLAILLLLGNGGESESPKHSDYYFGNASMKLFRFRDFEPRQQAEQHLVHDEREGRGFHFHASGQDVSVELEFIVPFFRIPVKRSMNLARNAFQSILNLRTGALINTAVVVAAGAIIAAVVRLILAPLVFTSLNNGGYILKSDKTIKRGMRGLTDAVESQLEEHNIDMTACMQRYICHYLQGSSSSTPVRLIHVLANSVVIWAASGEESMSGSASGEYEEESLKTSRQRLSLQQQYQQQQHQQRPQQHHHNQGFKLVSFDAVNKDIALGLDYLVPFLEVPIKRKRNAPPRPLLVINSAALVSCGLVAAGGLLVGHLIRSMGLESIVPDKPPQNMNQMNGNTTRPQSVEEMLSTTEPELNVTSRGSFDQEQNFFKLFDQVKLVYRNNTGQRMELSLPRALNTVEQTLAENDVNLFICTLKAICSLTYKAGNQVRKGLATDVEHVLDGATNWSWLLAWLEQSPLREAIQAGKVPKQQHCQDKYPRCKWNAPEEQLLQLVQNNVQFN
ncbi:uncharacterized protein [Drosophila tropicalis]|uniref:uncharacterized protein n=1 Tax=Drosophila tropicalis TaxID=46794 RepID=UPI0035AC0406